MTRARTQQTATHNATPSLIDGTMFALRRHGANSPTGPGKNVGAAKCVDPPSRRADSPSTDGRSSERPVAPQDEGRREFPVEARVAGAALKLMHAGEQAGAEALLTIIAGDLALEPDRGVEAPARGGAALVAPASAPPAKRGRAPPAWHAEVKRMRFDEKLSPTEIADRLGRDRALVCWVLDENGERAKGRARVNAHRLRHPERIEKPAKRRKRELRAAIAAPAVKMAAVKSFAAGEIDRETLSRILRGEAAP
jgi:hypothetical protein